MTSSNPNYQGKAPLKFYLCVNLGIKFPTVTLSHLAQVLASYFILLALVSSRGQ